jgi:hypothetical protein
MTTMLDTETRMRCRSSSSDGTNNDSAPIDMPPPVVQGGYRQGKIANIECKGVFYSIYCFKIFGVKKS